MKTCQFMTVSAIIGTILVASSIIVQEAHATGSDDMLSMMIETNTKLMYLTNSNSNFDEMPIGKVSFEINQIKKMLLEINQINDKNNNKLNKIYEHLTGKYDKAIEKYQKDVKEYQKENGLTMQEKKITSNIIKNKLIFKNVENQQNEEKNKDTLIAETIKESKSKKDFQKLVNNIGVKLANDANGGKVEKIHHKVAIKEIMSNKNWKLAIPAIDRVITQTNTEEFKEKLGEIKNNIKELLDKKEKQSNQEQVFALKTEGSLTEKELLDFEQGILEINLEQINDDEIIEILTEFEEVVDISDSLNVIEPIFEDELTESLEEVNEVTTSDDDAVKKKIKNQKDNPISSGKAQEVLSKKQSTGNNGNGNGNSGNGNGNNGNNDNGKGNGKGKGN